jgi:hypothetical protein
MYDKYPQPIRFLAKDGEKKRRKKQNSGIEHPNPPLESIDSYQPATQERERKRTRKGQKEITIERSPKAQDSCFSPSDSINPIPNPFSAHER